MGGLVRPKPHLVSMDLIHQALPDVRHRANTPTLEKGTAGYQHGGSPWPSLDPRRLARRPSQLDLQHAHYSSFLQPYRPVPQPKKAHGVHREVLISNKTRSACATYLLAQLAHLVSSAS